MYPVADSSWVESGTGGLRWVDVDTNGDDVVSEADASSYVPNLSAPAGGFGAVYLTSSTGGESRALKVLYPPHSLGSEDMDVWRFRSTNFGREALTAARFPHPNIIRVFDTLQVSWRYEAPNNTQEGPRDISGAYPLEMYVAEYIPDGVDRRLKDGRPFSLDEVIDIGVQVCRAVETLHSADPRVLHRDLNPGNIRLAENGRICVGGPACGAGADDSTPIDSPDSLDSLDRGGTGMNGLA